MPCRILIALLWLTISTPAGTLGQTPPSTACVQNKDGFRCNASTFAAALKHAATIAVDSQPFSEMANGKLNRMVRALGKTGALRGADLTFLLTRIDYGGIYYGPGDRELASLKVYARGIDGGRGPLLWVEPYFGKTDTPWPMAVQALIHQFKADIANLPR